MEPIGLVPAVIKGASPGNGTVHSTTQGRVRSSPPFPPQLGKKAKEGPTAKPLAMGLSLGEPAGIRTQDTRIKSPTQA